MKQLDNKCKSDKIMLITKLITIISGISVVVLWFMFNFKDLRSPKCFINEYTPKLGIVFSIHIVSFLIYIISCKYHICQNKENADQNF
jgi:hypothetical protein